MAPRECLEFCGKSDDRGAQVELACLLVTGCR